MNLLRKCVAVMMFVMSSQSFAMAEPDGEQAFGQEMASRLNQNIDGIKAKPSEKDPLEIKVVGDGRWDGATFNVHRIWLYCRQATEDECEISKTKFLENTTVVPSEATKVSLRIIVRHQDYVRYIENLPKQGDGEPVFEVFSRKIGSDLYALLALDSPASTALVRKDDLREMKLSESEAWTLATSQTKANLPAIPTTQQLMENPVAYQEYNYLGSLLLDLDSWSKLSAEVGPDMFITVVSDHFVFAAISPDGPDFESFKKTVSEDCAAQERCISPNIYRFRNEQWVASK